MATGFLKLYLDEIAKDKEDMKDYEKPIKLLSKLRKTSMLYSKRLDEIVAKSNVIFEHIEKDIKKIKPLKMFEKRVRLNQDDDVEVNGLLFACALVLRHRDLKNRKIFLDYKLAEDIYLDFENRDSKSINNAKAMALKYLQQIKGI